MSDEVTTQYIKEPIIGHHHNLAVSTVNNLPDRQFAFIYRLNLRIIAQFVSTHKLNGTDVSEPLMNNDAPNLDFRII